MEPADFLPEERAVLKFDGRDVAEAWYQAEGEVPILVVRILRETPQDLTLDRLLSAASVPAGEVESWRVEGLSEILSLSEPLPSAPITLFIRLKAAEDQDIPMEQWQALEAAWQTIIGLEAIIDSSRLGMEGLQSEMNAAFKRQMTVEEKLHALQADVAQWNKAKSRVHHALPKVREFVHRATWALAVPERKALEDVFKQYIETRKPHPEMDRVRERLEHFQKDRQVLLAQGNAVNQEGRAVLGEIQRALSTMQRNATDNARRKRSASKEKGKHF